MDKRLEAVGRLLDIMDELREKCPWDRKQTFDSLRMNTIEETYELADAILDHDLNEIRKELGDLLLHVVFYSKMGSEQQAFDLGDVANGICDKLVFRHPHVFGDTQADNAEQVKQNWEDIKLKEKAQAHEKKRVLSGVPRSLPAMVKAYRMAKRQLRPDSTGKSAKTSGRKSAKRSAKYSTRSTPATGGAPKPNSATCSSR